MFEKDLTKPLLLEKMEALYRRLPISHQKYLQVEEKLKNLKAGYNGEKTLRYFLSLIPEKKYHIFHDLRLPIGKSYFQIDALLLTPQFIYILECKNFFGTVIFEKNQLIQITNEKKKIYQNPLSQAHRLKVLLQYFFEKFQIPKIPIEHLFVISNSSTEINISAGYSEAEKRVCKAEHLLVKLPEAEKSYNKDIFDLKTMAKVKRLFLTKHTPKDENVLEMFQIDKRDLLRGVNCPTCSHIPMNYSRKVWSCPICKCVSSDAFIQGVNDYFLLMKPTITNLELRTFLQLPSPHSSAYIISLLKLPSQGKNKGRIYFPTN